MDALEHRLSGCISAGCTLVSLLFLAWIVLTVVAAQLPVPVSPGLILLGVFACIVLGSSASGGKRKAIRRDAGQAEGGGAGAPLLPPTRRRSTSPWKDLRDLSACRRDGLVTEEEFTRARAELLGLPEPPPEPKRHRRG